MNLAKFARTIATATVAAIAVAVMAPGTAFAASCDGAGQINGGYSVAITGVLSTGEKEALAGVLTSSGKCMLTGTLFGRIGQNSVNAVSVSGTYGLNTINQGGTLHLTIPGQPTRIFDINLANSRKQIIGFEIDESAAAKLDARKQQLSKSFDPTGVLGSYVETNQLIELPVATQTFGATATEKAVLQFGGYGVGGTQEIYYGSPPTYASSNILFGQYSISPDGTFTMTVKADGSNYQYNFGGSIDTSGKRLIAAYIGGTAPPYVGLIELVKQ